MSYKYKASKQDEEDLKEYTSKKTAEPDTKGLEKALKDHDSSLAIFSKADESYRKKVLKEDYAELKLKYGWKYDEPIE